MLTAPRALAVLACATLIVGIAFGLRQSFGLFVLPVSDGLGWGRETFSLVIALQALLYGLAAPFAGAVADCWGAARTVVAGGIAFAGGLWVLSASVTPTGMLLGGGVLAGIGFSACGMPILLAVVSRSAPEDKRSLWLGIVTSGGTAGQLLIIPGTQYVIAADGWQAGFTLLAAAAALILPLALCIGLAGRGDVRPKDMQSLGEALIEARGHRGYLLLMLGFFVCGFQVQFVASHLPAFVQDSGLGAQLAATSLVVIAFFNMFGAWLCGLLGGYYRKTRLLSSIYIARAAIIVAFVSFPLSEISVLVFSALIGFIWLGTVPLTVGVIAQVFGPRYVATLYSIVVLSHQLGNFAGAWVGGRVYDATGSYDAVWWMAALLGLFAAALHLAIDDRPVARLTLEAG